MKNKIKFAKILISLQDNVNNGTIVDCMFMKASNETIYEFMMEELVEFIGEDWSEIQTSILMKRLKTFIEENS